MAKSKIVKASKKIEKGVVGGYNAIENSVVGSYKAVENGFVKAFTNISDGFVDYFFTRDGETVEQAKNRMKQEAEDKKTEKNHYVKIK